jgi:hypothetical protein
MPESSHPRPANGRSGLVDESGTSVVRRTPPRYRFPSGSPLAYFSLPSPCGEKLKFFSFPIRVRLAAGARLPGGPPANPTKGNQASVKAPLASRCSTRARGIPVGLCQGSLPCRSPLAAFRFRRHPSPTFPARCPHAHRHCPRLNEKVPHNVPGVVLHYPRGAKFRQTIPADIIKRRGALQHRRNWFQKARNPGEVGFDSTGDTHIASRLRPCSGSRRI